MYWVSASEVYPPIPLHHPNNLTIIEQAFMDALRLQVSIVGHISDYRSDVFVELRVIVDGLEVVADPGVEVSSAPFPVSFLFLLAEFACEAAPVVEFESVRGYRVLCSLAGEPGPEGAGPFIAKTVGVGQLVGSDGILLEGGVNRRRYCLRRPKASRRRRYST